MQNVKNLIRSYLGRSEFMRSFYAGSRQAYARIYRWMKTNDQSEAYQRLLEKDAFTSEPGFYDGDLFEDGVRLKPHPKASNPVLTLEDITDAAATFVADPFVVYTRGVYDMFFEIKDVEGTYIGHAFSKDGVEYEYNQVVIDPETAHHTYPYVFLYNGEWIMIPSPGPNVKGEFRIYAADNYPTDWRLVATPIPDRVRQDPTPILWNDTWFLIYQDTDSMNIILKYADSLTASDWQEHPDSPIFPNTPETIERCDIGSAEMVPSGRPIYHDESVDIFYRSHADEEVYHYRITALSKEQFTQNLVTEGPVFQGLRQDKWNSRFMHTLNPVYPWCEADNIVAVDGLESDNYRYSIGIYTTTN